MAVPIALTSSRMHADKNTLPSSAGDAPMTLLAVKRHLHQRFHPINTQLGPHNSINYNASPNLQSKEPKMEHYQELLLWPWGRFLIGDKANWLVNWWWACDSSISRHNSIRLRHNSIRSRHNSIRSQHNSIRSWIISAVIGWNYELCHTQCVLHKRPTICPSPINHPHPLPPPPTPTPHDVVDDMYINELIYFKQ